MKLEGHCSVTFWLNRVAEEETKLGIELIKEAQTRNWQAVNFIKMPSRVQKEVLRKLKDKMKELGWDKSLEDSKEELEMKEDESK